MKTIKLIFGNPGARIWFIVTSVLVVLALVVAILASTVFYEVFCFAFGSGYSTGRGETMYYKAESTSKEDAFNRGNANNEKFCEEGFVLLKNKLVGSKPALPLSDSEKKLNIFGKNSINLVYGGSGSGGGRTEGSKTLYESLTSAGFICNSDLKSFYDNTSKSGMGRPDNPKIENDGNNSRIVSGETRWDAYDSALRSSASGDVALIVFSRIGGEGFDLPRQMTGDPTKHYLQLNAEEEALIEGVKSLSPTKIIVIINSSSVMEISSLKNDSAISACIQIGGPGYSGIMALGRILNGEVTPSGHTVDTWSVDFKKDPTWNNFGDNLLNIKNGNTTITGDQYKHNGDYVDYFYVDYEESIYVGYRYYETRGFTALSNNSSNDTSDWYEKNVVYPFGYGLSYTTFDWTIENVNALSGISITDSTKNEDIEIKINVKNTGSRKGKEVVQLYATAPFTSGGIEKSHVVLCGFEKTDELYPSSEANESKPNEQTITIKFNPYDIASYDYGDANGNGFKGYELDPGQYFLSLRTDAHTPKSGLSAITFSIAAASDGKTGLKYDKDPVTANTVESRFENADDQLDTLLSRDNWIGTWPNLNQNKELNDYANVSYEELTSMAHNNPNKNWTMPVTGAPVIVQLIDLKDLPKNDTKWDALLDSLTFGELKDLFNKGNYSTGGIPRIGKPFTLDSDGPVGYTYFGGEADIYGTVAYASEVILGSTWNLKVLKKMGESVGEEGIWGKQKVSPATPYSGWYAPGVNIHRSQFGGRNFEYFSEDGFLAGMLAAAEIQGAMSKGLYTQVKHFALNEQETHRDANGSCSWATEQSIREIYLKPFEKAVKVGKSRGLMSSFNRIGTKWTGGDYRLLTEVLREEWGFTGMVICDFNLPVYMNNKQMAYAGGDLNLTTTHPWNNPSATDAGDVSVLRRAAHNQLYTIVHSNAMNGIDKNTVLGIMMPTWQIVMIIIICVIGVALAVWGFFVIRSAVKKSKQEQK